MNAGDARAVGSYYDYGKYNGKLMSFSQGSFEVQTENIAWLGNSPPQVMRGLLEGESYFPGQMENIAHYSHQLRSDKILLDLDSKTLKHWDTLRMRWCSGLAKVMVWGEGRSDKLLSLQQSVCNSFYHQERYLLSNYTPMLQEEAESKEVQKFLMFDAAAEFQRGRRIRLLQSTWNTP